MNSTNFAREVGLKRRHEVPEREADPGNHHRPGFHAAQAVDTLLERVGAEQVLQREPARLLAFAIDEDRPGPGPQPVRMLGGIGLVRAELVEVVVAGHLGQRIALLAGRVAGVLLEFERLLDQVDRDHLVGARRPGHGCQRGACEPGEELAP